MHPSNYDDKGLLTDEKNVWFNLSDFKKSSYDLLYTIRSMNILSNDTYCNLLLRFYGDSKINMFENTSW